jgi:hypothetical protein
MLFAQDEMPPETAAPPAASAAAAAHRHARPSPAHPAVTATTAAQAAQEAADPAPTAAAPMPQWPINEQPAQPIVTWDSHGLSIDAANSSLQQILKAVAVATGAKVEGMTGDQRVFGEYGPGQARDVLSQLLLGAGFNVIMVGDLGQGAPRQILLSVRRTGTDAADNNANQANNNNDDDSADNDADDQQPVQPVMRPGFPGGFPRTPQQMLEERQRMMQERQQQIQQQLQNNQQNNPQN